jgi:uncharacterized protein YoaH (UPF0181 family)
LTSSAGFAVWVVVKGMRNQEQQRKNREQVKKLEKQKATERVFRYLSQGVFLKVRAELNEG